MSVSSESTEEVAARELYGADLEQDMAGMKLDKPVENAWVATRAKLAQDFNYTPDEVIEVLRKAKIGGKEPGAVEPAAEPAPAPPVAPAAPVVAARVAGPVGVLPKKPVAVPKDEGCWRCGLRGHKAARCRKDLPYAPKSKLPVVPSAPPQSAWPEYYSPPPPMMPYPMPPMSQIQITLQVPSAQAYGW